MGSIKDYLIELRRMNEKSFSAMLICLILALPLFAQGYEENLPEQQAAAFKWPDGKKMAISLTFDDARLSQIDKGLPILDSYGIKATFYLSAERMIQRVDGWKVAVSNGHDMGNHSLLHPCTGNFSWSRETALEDYTLVQMSHELDSANRFIKDVLGITPTSFGYPCVYSSELGRTVEEKMDGCRKFAEGTFMEGIGPGGGFFTLANQILHEGPEQQANYYNELQKIARETRLKIPLLQTEEGTHGLMCSGGTIFPEGPALGSTWNMDLLGQVYETAAREARAVGIHQLFTLVIEPNRDPRLGRNQGGYSEDTYLCSRIAETVVKAVQGSDVSAKDKVVAGLCHYPGQSQPVSGLERGAMEISERVLREVFLPPWEAGTPVVVVLINGRPLAIPWIDEHVPAIVEASIFCSISAGSASSVYPHA